MASPNLLFITLDQWRSECLSGVGHPIVQTPHLDALAQEGVLFRKHYGQSQPCGPSRVSIFTGMYLQNHRSVLNGTPVDARYTNLALEMNKLGYRFTVAGYMDFPPDPRLHHKNDPILKKYEGFGPGNHRILTHYSNETNAEWLQWVKEQGFDFPSKSGVYDPRPDYPGTEKRGPSYAPALYPKELSDTAFLTEHGLRFIQEQGMQPWCLHLSYLRPHPPWVAPEPYNCLYEPDEKEFQSAASLEQEAQQHPFLNYFLKNNLKSRDLSSACYPREDRSMHQLRATYYGLITELDDQIGRIIAHLKQSGVYEKTLIVIGSDHGEQMWDHHLLGKGSYFDQSAHIPLIIRAPGTEFNAARGRQVERFTENIDILPTILDYFEASLPNQCDGSSLLPFLRGEIPKNWRDAAHWEIDFRSVKNREPEKVLGIGFHECNFNVIRDDHFKYIHFSALSPLLFDIRNDPQELHNLAQDSAYMSTMFEYAQKLLSWRMAHDERAFTDSQVGVTWG